MVLMRTALVLVALGTVLVQVLLPCQAAEIGETYPEVQNLVLPYSIAAVLMVVCAQVALLSVWKLISRVLRATLYAKGSLKWIDAMRWSVLIGAGIVAIVAGHLLFLVGIGGPGVVLGFFAALVLGSAAFLLLTILRRVFTAARDEHAELAGVI